MQKILICDLDELFRFNLGFVLESKGFYVQEASRPSEGLKYVIKEKFNAIVFSLQSDNMKCIFTPDFSYGIQILSAIKAIDGKLPVIVVTDSNELHLLLSKRFSDCFIQKPVDCNEIEEALCGAVNVKADNK